MSLAEVLFGLGILALALFALLSVCSMALRYNRQNANNLRAAMVADTETGRTLASILNNTPPGTNTTFWSKDWNYPNEPYRKGSSLIGTETFSYAIYAQTIAGFGDPSSNNLARKIDTYVWWADPNRGGSHLTSCTRLLNEGETP